MEIILLLTIIGLIFSFIWNLINTILNARQNKRYKTMVLRLPVKKRLFNELYDLTKGLTTRMEFTEIKKQENFTVYNFQIREKNGEGYLSSSKQKTLTKRIGLLRRGIAKECDYKGVKVPIFELAKLKSISDSFYITYPNDDLPKDTEEIKKKLIKEIIELAKENGIKIKESLNP